LHPLVRTLATAAALAIMQAEALAQTAALAPPAAGETDVLSTAHDQAGRLTVPVMLGEKGPFRFMIDTGSQNTAISVELATRLALPSRGTANLIGVAGRVVVNKVEIDEIVLGRRSYYGIIAPVLQGGEMGADGILGLDSLQGQRVLIDFRRNRLLVGDADMLGGDRGFEIIVTARRRSGQLIMTDAIVDGVPVDVVIDSGSDTTLGNRALQRELGRRGQPALQSELISVTGQHIPADIGYAGALTIQGLRISQVLIAYADSPTFAALGLVKKPAIFLGVREMRVFPRIAIDFQKRRVLFDLPDSGEPGYFRDIQ